MGLSIGEQIILLSSPYLPPSFSLPFTFPSSDFPERCNCFRAPNVAELCPTFPENWKLHQLPFNCCRGLGARLECDSAGPCSEVSTWDWWAPARNGVGSGPPQRALETTENSENIFGSKSHLIKCKGTEVTPSVLSDHSGIKLERQVENPTC